MKTTVQDIPLELGLAANLDAGLLFKRGRAAFWRDALEVIRPKGSA